MLVMMLPSGMPPVLTRLTGHFRRLAHSKPYQILADIARPVYRCLACGARYCGRPARTPSTLEQTACAGFPHPMRDLVVEHAMHRITAMIEVCLQRAPQTG